MVMLKDFFTSGTAWEYCPGPGTRAGRVEPKRGAVVWDLALEKCFLLVGTTLPYSPGPGVFVGLCPKTELPPNLSLDVLKTALTLPPAYFLRVLLLKAEGTS